MAAAEATITLADGRRLGFARFGARDGLPILFCHGFPSSRLEAARLADAARDQGVTLVAPDRPGIGLSDAQPGRRIVDWPADALQLMSALGAGRFALIGCSGGFPYAAACAAAAPERITACASIAGLGPTTEPALVRAMSLTARLGFRLARRTPQLFALAYGALGRLVTAYPALVFALNETTAPDRRVLERPGIRDNVRDAVREAFRQGTAGAVLDLRLLADPWGIELGQIAVPLTIWHGTADGVVPMAMAEHTARTWPDATLRRLAGEGHLSIVCVHAAAILRSVAPPP